MLANRKDIRENNKVTPDIIQYGKPKYIFEINNMTKMTKRRLKKSKKYAVFFHMQDLILDPI